MTRFDPSAAVGGVRWSQEEIGGKLLAPLQEVVERLAPLRRRAGSEDERAAADWLLARFRQSGVEAALEEESFRDGYARQLLPLSLIGALAAAVNLSPRSAAQRARWSAAAALAAAAVVDDVSNGRRLWRRLTSRRRACWNVVAEPCGHRGQPTLVVLAHHDSAPTGRVFDQRLQRRFAKLFPEAIERIDTSLPLWWPIAGAPALSAIAVASGDRRLLLAALGLCAVVSALGADVARSPVTPGANDNLSGVAALVALAEQFRSRPPAGLRVLLVSCAAEEVLQGGIYGFAKRHFPELPAERTWFVNLDTIGSPRLVMLEAEGCFRMERYPGVQLRDLIAEVAAQQRIGLLRGLRSRSSTDAVVPARSGYPTATLVSFDQYRCLSNYHLMSDRPENLRYETIASAVSLTAAVADRLAGSLASDSGYPPAWGEGAAEPGATGSRFRR